MFLVLCEGVCLFFLKMMTSDIDTDFFLVSILDLKVFISLDILGPCRHFPVRRWSQMLGCILTHHWEEGTMTQWFKGVFFLESYWYCLRFMHVMVSSLGYISELASRHMVPELFFLLRFLYQHFWSRNDSGWFPASVGIMTVTWQLWIWIWMDVYMRQDDRYKVLVMQGEGEATRNRNRALKVNTWIPFRVQRRFLKDLEGWWCSLPTIPDIHASPAWSLIKCRLHVWLNKLQTKPSALWKFAQLSILCKAACLAHMDRNLFENVAVFTWFLQWMLLCRSKAKSPIILCASFSSCIIFKISPICAHSHHVSIIPRGPRPIRPGWRFWAAKSNGYPPERLSCFNWCGMILVSFPS